MAARSDVFPLPVHRTPPPMKIECFETTATQTWQRRPIAPEGFTSATGFDLNITAPAEPREWEGFGGCFNELGWIALQSLEDAERRSALRRLFHPESDCRLTFCRIPIGASDYAQSWYSCNETEGDFSMRHFTLERDRQRLIPYIHAAQEHQPGLRFFASPWSPPTWMKNPPVYNYGQFRAEPRFLEAYARYFLKFVSGYAEEGISIGQVHVQNEPVADQKFPSCVWTAQGLRDFIRDHIGPLFRRENPSCEVWLGTLNTEDYDGYVLPVLSDAAARLYLGGVSFQWAGKAAIQRTRESWSGLRLMQSENECGDGTNSWAYAHYVFGLFRHYIANGATSYIYWNMVLPPEGRSTWGWKQNSLITADPLTGKSTLNPEFHVLKHFSHYVREGAVIMKLEGPWTGNALAFLNPDGSLVVIAANPLGESRTLAIRHGTTTFEAELAAEAFATFFLTPS